MSRRRRDYHHNLETKKCETYEVRKKKRETKGFVETKKDEKRVVWGAGSKRYRESEYIVGKTRR